VRPFRVQTNRERIVASRIHGGRSPSVGFVHGSVIGPRLIPNGYCVSSYISTWTGSAWSSPALVSTECVGSLPAGVNTWSNSDPPTSDQVPDLPSVQVSFSNVTMVPSGQCVNPGGASPSDTSIKISTGYTPSLGSYTATRFSSGVWRFVVQAARWDYYTAGTCGIGSGHTNEMRGITVEVTWETDRFRVKVRPGNVSATRFFDGLCPVGTTGGSADNTTTGPFRTENTGDTLGYGGSAVVTVPNVAGSNASATFSDALGVGDFTCVVGGEPCADVPPLPIAIPGPFTLWRLDWTNCNNTPGFTLFTVPVTIRLNTTATVGMRPCVPGDSYELGVNGAWTGIYEYRASVSVLGTYASAAAACAAFAGDPQFEGVFSAIGVRVCP
jgi:hypothetical protein